MKKYTLQIEQTIATLIVEEQYLSSAREVICRLREELKAYISFDPLFELSLTPRKVSADAPEIVKRMAAAAKKAQVGPMAAVAGAIASLTVEALREQGASTAIFDNGGDIALVSEEPVTIGIYHGLRNSNDLALKIPPTEKPLGVCTSSGTIGHSVSLGKADAAVVISNDASLADAAATALGNMIQTTDETELVLAMETILRRCNVEGLLVFIKNSVGFCGKVPQLILTPSTLREITKA
ncbi:MAG: UPF0280 family protein [Candidatus Heimdallarchaeota archaeon]